MRKKKRNLCIFAMWFCLHCGSCVTLKTLNKGCTDCDSYVICSSNEWQHHTTLWKTVYWLGVSILLFLMHTWSLAYYSELIALASLTHLMVLNRIVIDRQQEIARTFLIVLKNRGWNQGYAILPKTMPEFLKHRIYELQAAKILQRQQLNLLSKRKSIPKRVRLQIWKRDHGNKVESKCPVCNVKLINILEFHIGHIISLHHGGLNEASNFQAICSVCNHDMGTESIPRYQQRLTAL